MLLDLAAQLEKIDEVTSCEFVAPYILGIRISENQSDPLKMIECSFEEGERSIVRFECSLDLVGMVGKKRSVTPEIRERFRDLLEYNHMDLRVTQEAGCAAARLIEP